MSPFTAELLGTMLLIIFGDGVVANVLLNKTKGHNSGWIVITAGWGFGVALAIYCVGSVSQGHLNPAVTLALASIGAFDWDLVPLYIVAQMAGALLGSVAVWLAYLPHWAETPDPASKLGVFCTAPAVRDAKANLICEILGTAVLLLGVLLIGRPGNLNVRAGWDTGFGPFLVGLLVWGIGLSLGGPTGYAINPARDLGPRLAHALLPIAGKGGSDWKYAWVPVAGPILGGLLGAHVFKWLNTATP